MNIQTIIIFALAIAGAGYAFINSSSLVALVRIAVALVRLKSR
jgi:hypothetical protein